MWAVRLRKERCVELLLAHRDVDINCSDNVSDLFVYHFISVLLYLSVYINLQSVSISSLSQQNGRTALHWALQ